MKKTTQNCILIFSNVLPKLYSIHRLLGFFVCLFVLIFGLVWFLGVFFCNWDRVKDKRKIIRASVGEHETHIPKVFKKHSFRSWLEILICRKQIKSNPVITGLVITILSLCQISNVVKVQADEWINLYTDFTV